ncbi:DUF7096 domain-containing protein [Halorarum salinum]|uniref:DUF7096 domain-containing protein n=1 Tax=Halorarum salinum TaxID=2743089 RepID=A0A7D5L931_9EURY|nr:hypothetical protein [Halobaculum salinum]QLG60850.1 hypothetical protein HUG12_03445 [Halobaculum salinum]
MERLTAALVAAMLVTAGLPAAAAVTGQTAGEEARPGAQFAGAVGVQGAEVRGEVEGRTLDERLEAADSDASRAGVVAGESDRAEERLADLRERRSTLRDRYENGSVSESEYRARLAGIAAESRALERRLNRTSDAARSLPPEAAREHGVNASEVETLRADAASLTDDEAADAARGVAGEGAGNGLGVPPEDRGRQGDRDESGDRGAPVDGGDDSGPAGPADDRGTGGSAGEGARNGTAGEGGAGSDDARGTGNATVGEGNATVGEGNVTVGEGNATAGDDRAGDPGNGTDAGDRGNGSSGVGSGNADPGPDGDGAGGGHGDDADDAEATATEA